MFQLNLGGVRVEFGVNPKPEKEVVSFSVDPSCMKIDSFWKQASVTIDGDEALIIPDEHSGRAMFHRGLVIRLDQYSYEQLMMLSESAMTKLGCVAYRYAAHLKQVGPSAFNDCW